MKNFKLAEPDTEYAHKRVENLYIPRGFEAYNNMISEMS